MKFEITTPPPYLDHGIARMSLVLQQYGLLSTTKAATDHYTPKLLETMYVLCVAANPTDRGSFSRRRDKVFNKYERNMATVCLKRFGSYIFNLRDQVLDEFAEKLTFSFNLTSKQYEEFIKWVGHDDNNNAGLVMKVGDTDHSQIAWNIVCERYGLPPTATASDEWTEADYQQRFATN